MNATTAPKMTRTQRETWDKIRHAVPVELNEIGELHADTTMRDGLIHSAGNRAQTMNALVRLGLIEAVAVSSSMMRDVVRPAGDLGRRHAAVIAEPGHDARVCWAVRIVAEDGDISRPLASLHGRDKSRDCNVAVPAGTVERIAEILRAHGWEVA